MGWRKGYIPPNPRTKYCGVYAVRHVATGQMYIGGSIDITGRYTHHRYCLRRGIHKTKALQSLWNRDGEQAFVFEQLQLCDRSVLVELEDQYIKNTASCLNTADGAVTGLNNNVSTQAKKDAAKKRWADPEYRAKREAWLANRVNGRFTRNPHAQ